MSKQEGEENHEAEETRAAEETKEVEACKEVGEAEVLVSLQVEEEVIEGVGSDKLIN